MTIKKSIERLKSEKPENSTRIRKEIGKAFEGEKEKAANAMIDSLEDYYKIVDNENRIVFIYGLRLAVKVLGRDFFPTFTAFITKNIQSDCREVRREVIKLTGSLVELLSEEDLSESEKMVFTEFIDEVLLLLEKYYDSEFENYVDISEIPPSVYKSLEILLSRIMNPGQKERSYDKKTGMPKWMDCTWKRVPCMEENCPVCSKLKDLEEDNLFDRGEFLIDVSKVGDEDDDVPKPNEFPFYKEVKDWLEVVISIAEESKRMDNFWVFTEEAADLFWYMNVLSAKTYRQLCNRYLIENENDENKVDYNYTNYVLKETVKKIKKSLKIIADNNQSQRSELEDAFERISEMEERIFNI